MKALIFIRSILASLFLIVFTAYQSTLFLLTIPLVRRREYTDWIISSWGRTLLKAFRVRLETSGFENIPEGGAIIVFNHTSHFDILAITAVLPKGARFGAKIELFKIPLFGMAMRAAGVLPIRRAERERVLQLYEDSIPRLHNGERFLLAGEGKRHPDPGVGEKFKSGPFIFAIGGQVPVVPIVIKGARECLPKGRLIACLGQWRHTIKLRVLPPVATSGLSQDDRPRLQDEVRNLMTEAYQRL